MAQVFQKTSSIKLPQWHREAKREEYGRQSKGISECPICGNMHFKKRWYASGTDLAMRLKIKKLLVGQFIVCPACRMAREHLFEGELFIEGAPRQARPELLRLIHNFGKRAKEADPQDRIIKIEKDRKNYRVTTTENQLAVKLAKKIRDVLKNVKIRISYAAKPSEVNRVYAIFK